MAAPARSEPTASPSGPWRLSVDTGGTFTDCVAVAPDGSTRRGKVLSDGTLRATVTAAPQRGPAALGDGHPARRFRIGLHLAGSIAPTVLRGMTLTDEQDRPLGQIDEIDETDAIGGDAALLDAHDDRAAAVLGAGMPIVGSVVRLTATHEAPILAAHAVTATPTDAVLPPLALRLATTRATNALLERHGAGCALLITAGFEDLLRIGDQRRPELFARDIVRPPALAQAVIGVRERCAADGEVVTALTEAECRRIDELLRELQPRVATVALSLLHAWAHPEHERRLAEHLRGCGWTICASSEIAPSIGLLTRTQTTVAEAFLAPIMHAYLRAVGTSVGRNALHVLTSAGGLVAAARFAATDGLLSGPAGGVAGAQAIAERIGIARAISFDMGGTSTDVARIDRRAAKRPTHRVGDIEIACPALAIETVAAGGGSICTFDGLRLAVGPQSAGADPGPACYGRGGPLTVTDVNLLLGRLVGDRFGIPIRRDAAEKAADRLFGEVRAVRDDLADRAAMLESFLQLADERMAEAMAAVSLRQGVDPRDYAIVAFGGAGGLHACRVAERLGIRRVLLPRDAGILSAVGLASASIERVVTTQLLCPLAARQTWTGALRAAQSAATERVRSDLPPGGEDPTEAPRVVERTLSLRIVGQDACIDLALDALGSGRDLLPTESSLEQRFCDAYAQLFGHRPGSVARTDASEASNRSPARIDLQVESVRVVAAARDDRFVPGRTDAASDVAVRDTAAPTGETSRPVRWDGQDGSATLLDAAALKGDFAGPALILLEHGSAAVPPGWRGTTLPDGTIDLRHEPNEATPAVDDATPKAGDREDPATEIVASRLMSIATEMGEILRRTAVSTNVRERLDYSCGVLDAAGELVANAPHVPVHLGALGPCVRSVAEVLAPQPGDVLVTNHPAFGGSHLPDVTVLTPVHDDGQPPRLIGWVASRAHHAEIGGIRPGSMAPDARSLAEEGVVISPLRAVEGGEARLDRVEALLKGGPWPSRTPALNLADLRAAMAANAHGARRLVELAESLGAARLGAHMAALSDHAAGRCRAALRALGARHERLEEKLDDGTRYCVAVELDPDAAEILLTVDLRGTDGPHRGNLNATPAIVASVVAYVLRLLIDDSIPLNEGLLRPVRILLEPSLLDPPFGSDPNACPAVGAGNTEISQRLADTLIRALGLSAGSQATMNNVVFGNRHFGHYETLGGGAGASSEHDGADAVHTHMTNTAITDPEILEHRLPVRLERFAVRTGSGGRGRRCGGDGLIREWRFLESMELSLLGQRRVDGPPGADGGGAGAPGRQTLIRTDGARLTLASLSAVDVNAGDRLVVETPGGGAWGAESENGS